MLNGLNEWLLSLAPVFHVAILTAVGIVPFLVIALSYLVQKWPRSPKHGSQTDEESNEWILSTRNSLPIAVVVTLFCVGCLLLGVAEDIWLKMHPTVLEHVRFRLWWGLPIAGSLVSIAGIWENYRRDKA